jgi:hypothetical protein
MAAAAIDFEKPGKYPIVLSDALLGKSTNSIYTGVRCKIYDLDRRRN